ncbi:GNAT family N-acetyltransferase [uncultured Alsobacter sp.]|uniref:GNAT family N-acetyltransferase n=1 Tax=uncultured Alsobacter sp. TaxID=1748258 RepID=UPI0025D540DF|nr:GNAT family N-acetyltransferase [uncultured Alsobacter sp.]
MTGLPAWHEEAISKSHDRRSFDCGDGDLNQFLAQYARQAHEAGSAKTYCAVVTAQPAKVLGFYTISPAQIEFAAVPMQSRPRTAGRYPFGCFRLGRLAVDRSCQGRGLGSQLLASALERCCRASKEVGGTALLIDAKDDAGAGWYEGFGALRLLDRPLSLVLTYAEYNRARVMAGLEPL